jgi:hypothetical protein
MTVIELAISTFLLIMLSGSLTAALINVRGVFDQGSIQSKQQDAGERLLSMVGNELRRSGFVTVGPDTYPHMFDEGNALFNFANHWHPAPTHLAVAGDPDFGVTREIVFVQPQMATNGAGDEVPTLDAQGIVQWNATEISYVLITGADGVNYVERRVNGANPRRIASHVERLAFDDINTTAGGLLADTVRIQVFFREVDEKGVVHRHQAETTVALRNG